MTFTAPFFRKAGSNWRFTVPLSAGSLTITNEPAGRRLRYDFSTRRIALMGTVMLVGFLAFIAASGLTQFPWWIALFGWLWLVGINYLISFLRAPSWVRSRVSDAASIRLR